MIANKASKQLLHQCGEREWKDKRVKRQGMGISPREGGKNLPGSKNWAPWE